MRLLLIIGMLLALGATAFAQQISDRSSATPATTTDPMIERMGGDSAPYSRSITGKVLTVNPANGYFVVENLGKGRMGFTVDKKSRLRADKNTSLAGKPDLSLSDYKPGDVVKLIYRGSDAKVLEVRLKRPEN